MKALEILKNHIEDLNYMVAIFDEYAMIKTRDETKKSIIELTGAIKEIEYALAKPYYADVHLNNAIRFLREEHIDEK